ncbi:MAG TPA: phosphoenolpyruvate carboxykinase (ATP), partial [Actinobacteria bacterium]|nr:phosphoenolpyruvate carboxykinase (ATP) [Actinomycetota bacterium]
RAVFSLSDLGRFKDAADLGKVDYLLILNWNENIIPAVSRLTQEQAAAYFMLGETTGTSAGGAAEEGKFLRVPGTNPFFPLRHGLQGNRFLSLLDTHPMEVYLMNTGRIGGRDGDERSKKIKIPTSSAVVKAIA